jgi:hypothetical protein
MTDLDAWLARQARRQSRRPELLEALLLGRGVAYARYRLGAVFLRLLLRTALHTFELLFLAQVLPAEYLAPLLTYRALTGFIAGLHWGASEGLRARVRQAMRARNRAAARRAIEGWLIAVACLGALPIALLALRVAPDLFGPLPEGLSLFDAYGLACFVRLACDAYARTYHAGIFALRRVYRPLWSLLGVDVLELGLIWAAFERYGAWSIPIAIALAGALDAALTIRYATRAYRRQRLQAPAPLQRLWRGAFRRRTRAAGGGKALSDTLRSAFVHSVANATLQLDALLLLLLVWVDPPRANAASLALLYYALRPLLGLATHWVRTFYFDLSRIDNGPLRAFRPRLLRFLGRLALACAGFGGLLTLLLALLLWPERQSLDWLWLIPFVLSRSVFALAQLKAFTAGRYQALLWVSGSLALALGAIALAAHSGVAVLGGAALMLAAGAWVLREVPGPIPAADGGEVLGLGAFLRELRGRGSVQLGVLSVARRSAEVGRVLKALLAFGPSLRLSRHARCQVLLLAPAELALSKSRLIAASGGALSQVWLSSPGTALEGIGLAREQAALPRELHDALGPNAPERRSEQLVAEFRRSFPAGALLDLEAGTGALDPNLLPRPWLGAFIHHVVAASQQRELRAPLPLSLAVYAPGGQASLVFVAAPHAPGFAAFRARVRAASLRASLYAETAPTSARRAKRAANE